MRFVQKVSGLRTEFDFQEKGIQYLVSDRTGTREAFTPYESIQIGNRLEVQKPIFSHLVRGVLMLFFGGISLLISAAYHDIRAEMLAFFCIAIGGISVGYAKWKKTKYTILKGTVHNLVLIRDKQYDEILQQITRRWKDRFKILLAHIDPANPPEKELKKFEWLRDNDIISIEEFTEAAKRIPSKH
jgi:hypothetical protein